MTRLLSCPFSELAGLHCEHEGKLWRIEKAMPHYFRWKGRVVHNRRGDKWLAKETRTGETELFAFTPVCAARPRDEQGREWPEYDYGRADLSGWGTFYRAESKI